MLIRRMELSRGAAAAAAIVPRLADLSGFALKLKVKLDSKANAPLLRPIA